MDHDNHPCFSRNARHSVARIHLPVAPRCNMQCNYCNRDFECVNESRPGVTSVVLGPLQAADYLETVIARIEGVRVVGIAGPGDPFANGNETMETLRLVRERHPEMMLCVATNGLDMAEYIDDCAALKISHVTVTVNAVEADVGRQIYAWARYQRRMYRGADAAALIIEKQAEAVAALKAKGITVKINTVVIPGINDAHVPEVAKRMGAMNADIQNCISLYHVAGTPLAGIVPPSPQTMKAVREQAAVFMPQMSHCARCRADAAGLIGEAPGTEVMTLLQEAAHSHCAAERRFVAVASMEGLFVNQHLGEASTLWIYGMKDGEVDLVERRATPAPGGGMERWAALAATIGDCHTVLVSGIGPSPQIVLERAGIQVVTMEGLAHEGIEAVLAGREIPKILLRTPGRCGIGQQCRGSGTGCG